MKTARRWIKRAALALAALLLLFALFLVATPQGRTAARTAGLVLQILPDFPVKPLPWFTADPERIRTTYPVGEGETQADIYRVTGEDPQAAVVLFLGVNPAGRDDERVVNLANGLARAGFVVLVPWSENMVNKRVDPTDIELLVEAFEFLKSQDYVDPSRMGGAGFCVGSSLLTVAAADARIRDDVAFINFFSGYYDVNDFLRQFAAGQTFYDGTVEAWDPNSLTKEVFTHLLIDGLPDLAEREVLSRHFISGESLTASERAGLSGPADAVYELLSGPTLEETNALLERLSPSTQQTMARLSPSNYVNDVRAELYIMHDREDDLAPVEESRRLADATAGRDGGRYTEFSFFSHVDPGEQVGWLAMIRESSKLFVHLYSIVRIAS